MDVTANMPDFVRELQFYKPCIHKVLIIWFLQLHKIFSKKIMTSLYIPFLLLCVCSVQFHPEHCAGPEDLECLFDVFLDVTRQFVASPQTFSSVKAYLTDKLVYVPGEFVC